MVYILVNLIQKKKNDLYIEGFIRSWKSRKKFPEENKVSRGTFVFQKCFS